MAVRVRRWRDVVPASTRQALKERVHTVVASWPLDGAARREIRRSVEEASTSLRASGRAGGLVAGVALVRDEEDVIETAVRQVQAEGIDVIVVFDHGSCDRTPQLLDGMHHAGLPVIRVPFRCTGYYQAALMTAAARMFASCGFTWVLPFDADELWIARSGRVSEVLRTTGGTVVRARVLDHLPSRADDAREPSPFLRLVDRRRTPASRPKVAFRPSRFVMVYQGNHEVLRLGRRVDGLEVRHFPVRSLQHLEAKLAVGRTAMRAGPNPAFAARPLGRSRR